MSNGRFLRSLFLGIFITPLAGYLGVLTMPAVALAWLFSLVVLLISGALKAAIVQLAMPALEGAWYAWPVTVFLLPIATLIFRSANSWLMVLYAGLGATGGIASVYLLSLTQGSLISSASRSGLVVAGGFSGAVLGLLFGYMIWRLDRNIPEQSAAPSTTWTSVWRLGLLLSCCFLIAAGGYLFSTSDKQSGPDAMTGCGANTLRLSADDHSSEAVLHRFMCSRSSSR